MALEPRGSSRARFEIRFTVSLPVTGIAGSGIAILAACPRPAKERVFSIDRSDRSRAVAMAQRGLDSVLAGDRHVGQRQVQ